MQNLRIKKKLQRIAAISLSFLLMVLPIYAEEPDPKDPSTWKTPYEASILRNAQQVYDKIIQKHGNADIYQFYLRSVRSSYEDTLKEAEKYNQIYDFGYSVCEFAGSVAISVVLAGTIAPDAGLTTADERIKKVLAKEVLSAEWSDVTNLGMDTVLESLGYDIRDLNAETFVFFEAQRGLSQIHTQELTDLMRKAEKNGGRFESAEDAATFLRDYLDNERGFASLHMGYSYYMDQLQKSSISTLQDLVWDWVKDNFVGAFIQNNGLIIGEVTEIIAGVQSGVMFDLFDQISSHFNDTHITEWAEQMKAIDQETETLLGVPFGYMIVEPVAHIFGATWEEAYEKVKQELQASNELIGFPEYTYYATFDIQGDGIPELFFWDNHTLENEQGYLVYTYDGSDAVLAGKIYRYAWLRSFGGAVYAMHYAPSTWMQVINCYRLDERELTREFFFSQEMASEGDTDIPESVTEWTNGTPIGPGEPGPQ